MRTTILGIFLIICAIVGYLTKLIEATEASGLIAIGIGFRMTQDEKSDKSNKRIGGGNTGTIKK